MVLASARAAEGVLIRASMNVIPVAKALISMTSLSGRQNPSHAAQQPRELTIVRALAGPWARAGILNVRVL
jgi:hypothetical protein